MIGKKLFKSAPVALSLFLFAACEHDTTPLKAQQKITREQAVRIAVNKILQADSVNKAIYAFRELLPRSATISTVSASGDPARFYSVNYESWFLLVDDEYLILEWPHQCRYVFVNAETGECEVFNDYRLPARFAEVDTPFVWARPQTKLLPPLNFQDESHGCGNVVVFKFNREYTVTIIVWADTAKLRLAKVTKTFELREQPNGLAVYLDFYDYLPEGNGILNQYYCNDVSYRYKPPKQWTARQGQVLVTLSAFNNEGRGYKATIRLINVHLFDGNGLNEVVIDQLFFKEVFVGWLPG